MPRHHKSLPFENCQWCSSFLQLRRTWGFCIDLLSLLSFLQSLLLSTWSSLLPFQHIRQKASRIFCCFLELWKLSFSEWSKANFFPRHFQCLRFQELWLSNLLLFLWCIFGPPLLSNLHTLQTIHLSWLFLWNHCLCICSIFLISGCTWRQQVLLLYKFTYFSRIFDWWQWKWVCLSDLLLSTLYKRKVTEKWVLIDKSTILFVTFGNHTCYGVSECLSIDEPKEWWFESFDGSWSRSWVQKSQLSETFSSFYVPFHSSIYLYC